MATYEQYPTPPPTSSPKHAHSTYHPFSPKLPAQDTYYQDTQPQPSHEHIEHKLPAQETYYKQSYNTPASPTHWDPSSHPPNDHPIATTTTSYEYIRPRRKSSPIQSHLPSHQSQNNNQNSNNPYHNPPLPFQDSGYSTTNGKSSPRISPTTTPYPPHRPFSRTKTRTPPRPIYFSPTNPLPTPYNVSRPSPRPGFISRILTKLSKWLRRLLSWGKRNPIKAGLASFLPILAGAGIVRAGKALGLGGAFAGMTKVLGMLGSGIIEGMGGGKPMKQDGGGIEFGGRGSARKVEEEVKEKKEWGWGMDHFVGFGGTKDSPLDGMLKVLMMGVNQYCKLTPSAVPRAASILLELYFLEAKR